MDNRVQTVIVPRPLTLTVLGSFLAYQQSGIIIPSAFYRSTAQKPPQGVRVCMSENRVVNLWVYSVHDQEMELILKRVSPEIQRWINWMWFGKNASGYDSLAYLLKQLEQPWFGRESELLSKIHTWIKENQDLDPWKNESAAVVRSWWQELELTLQKKQVSGNKFVSKLPSDKKYVHLPCFPEKSGFMAIQENLEKPTNLAIDRDPALPDAEITGTVQIELVEGHLLRLCGQSIAVGIGGIPNSGKSTLCVSLAAEMEAIIRSIKTRSGWPHFDLSIGVVNLDLATPTVEAIAQGIGQNREKLVAAKKKWTIELAEEARLLIENARKKYSIVLCDLPGGKPDDITRIIASGLDAGIMITKDWEAAKEIWPSLFKTVGVNVVSRIRSRLPHEGFSSLLTHRRPGERVSGRVSGLYRNTKAWDKFVDYLATFLLFEILPNLYGNHLPVTKE